MQEIVEKIMNDRRISVEEIVDILGDVVDWVPFGNSVNVKKNFIRVKRGRPQE